MADKDKPEENKEKRKGLLSGSRVPLDAVLLVVAPFVTFVVLFMYVMGLLPPRAMTVKVVGAAPMEESQRPDPVQTEDTFPSSYGTPDEAIQTGEAVDHGNIVSAQAEPTDSVSLDASGPALSQEGIEGTPPGVPETEDEEPEEPTEAAPEVDSDRMERIQRLAKVYEQMNASSVAAIVTTMNEEDAVDILASMKPRNAAKVLASLAPEKAATLSLRLTE